jgi:AcrR family transcriptional regulator
MELFAERGFEGTRIVDIARRAGVSHGTVGIYFSTKETLLRAVVERMSTPKLDAARALIGDETASAAGHVEALGRFWFGHLLTEEMQHVMRITEAALGGRPDFALDFRDRVLEPAMDLFRVVLRRGVASGEFACDDIDTYAHFLFASLGHIAEWNGGMGCALEAELNADAYLAVWIRAGIAGLRPVG